MAAVCSRTRTRTNVVIREQENFMSYLALSQLRFHSTALFQVADCLLQVVADSAQAAEIWQEAGVKYQMTQVSADTETEVSGTVGIFCEAPPPLVPHDWEMELIEDGASFTDGKELWLVVADSMIVRAALPGHRIQIWVGDTAYARSTEGLGILLAYAFYQLCAGRDLWLESDGALRLLPPEAE